MTPETRAMLRGLIVAAEGLRRTPYRDARGILTVGVGHRTDEEAIPLSRVAIDAILEGDLDEMELRCSRRLRDWAQLDDVRQATLMELAFNGVLFASPEALTAMQARDWERAAAELLDGPWAGEVGSRRSGRLVAQLLSGQWVA